MGGLWGKDSGLGHLGPTPAHNNWAGSGLYRALSGRDWAGFGPRFLFNPTTWAGGLRERLRGPR